MKYSVVIPIHNEEDSVVALCRALKKVFSGIPAAYEIIFVDDASTDRSVERLRTTGSETRGMMIVRLADRRGLATALQAGFDRASGERIVTLDGDLQNDPADIPKLIQKMEEGFDVVCGWRKKRSDPILKKISSKIANYFRRILMKEKIHDVGCTLKIFKKEVLKSLRLSGALHRFLSLLVVRQGWRIAEVPVSHHPRKFGSSKFGIGRRLVEGLVDACRIQFTDPQKIMKAPDYTIKEIIKNDG